MIARHEGQPALRACPPMWWPRLRIVVLALAATHTIWAATFWFTGIDLQLRDGRGTVDALNVLAATLVAGGVAWAVAALLQHFTRRARMAWTMGCLFSLGGSLIGPLDAGAGTGSTAVLVLMHLTVAIILGIGFRKTLSDQ
jgi:hypothetical protein